MKAAETKYKESKEKLMQAYEAFKTAEAAYENDRLNIDKELKAEFATKALRTAAAEEAQAAAELTKVYAAETRAKAEAAEAAAAEAYEAAEEARQAELNGNWGSTHYIDRSVTALNKAIKQVGIARRAAGRRKIK